MHAANDSPELSICIPTYNRSRYLDNLLNELAGQIHQLNYRYEILIGDNCSPDTTPDVVARYQDKLNIRYFRRPANLGSGENLNQLYRCARGKYVLYLADDDLPILSAINDNLEVFEYNPSIGTIFAPWFIHDLPTRQDTDQFYQQEDDYLIEQHDYSKLLALLLSHHIFPEIYLARREVIDQLYFNAIDHAFWAFVHSADMLGQQAIYFSKTPFYRSVARYFEDEGRNQAGVEEVKYAWDRYRGGLEYLLGKFSSGLSPADKQEWLQAINQFILIRMKVGLRIRTHEGTDWIDNYYIANRVKALGGPDDLPAPYNLYRVNAAFEFLTKQKPFLPEETRLVRLRHLPLQIFPYAHAYASTEFLELGEHDPIPPNSIVVTPMPLAPRPDLGPAVLFLSENEAVARFP